MGSKKFVIVGGIVAVVAAAALLVPSLALGQPIASVLPGATAAQVDDGPGNGQGKAWGHHKDSPDFPGQGKGLDKNSPDFPGQGKGLEKNKDKGDPAPKNGNGNKFGHDKGEGNPHNDD